MAITLNRGFDDMRPSQRWLRKLKRRLRGGDLPIIYHRDYRLPLSSRSARPGLEPRRADFVAWTLMETGTIHRSQFITPPRISYQDLSRVHTPRLLESLEDPEILGRIFATQEPMVVKEVLATIRLAVGGTLMATRRALDREGPSLNLLGGLHHAEPDKAAGFCPVNDIAVTIARLRSEGFDRQINIIDLDAHPPDGTAVCLADDPRTWIGSISGVDWGPLPGRIQEYVLTDANDAIYLATLDRLLESRPSAALTFVLAGGDVLAEDPLGGLSLSLEGALVRDQRVAQALDNSPSVWLSAGGYSDGAWRLLARTAAWLDSRQVLKLPPHYDPLHFHFSRIAQSLEPDLLDGGPLITEEDLYGTMGFSGSGHSMVLGHYTQEGIEYALERYGLLSELRRMGYYDFQVMLEDDPSGDRLRLYGQDGDRKHLLIEAVLERYRHREMNLLYIHWLTLMNPRAHFDRARPKLPGQEHPGLGLAPEVTELFSQVAIRLGLEGVGFKPAHYHVAYAARTRCHFVDREIQARFLGLVAAVSQLPLKEATRAISEGQLLLDEHPYRWQSELMVCTSAEPEVTAPEAIEAWSLRFRLLVEPPPQPPAPDSTAV